ncbi:MAG TPA: sulfate permease [Pseudomonadales bacterium]
MMALLEARREGLLQSSHWLKNITAGVIVGIVALPLAMAFAIASGVRPEQGLYTAIVAGILVAVFGGTRVQIAGPTGAFIVILAGITAQYGVSGLQVATMMAGLILLLMGMARLGAVIKFIPEPVIVGFTAGIGIIIWVGQWKDFFGLPAVMGEHFHEKLIHLLQALPHFHWATTALSVLGLTLLLLVPRIPGLKRAPAPLVAMLIVTVVQAIYQFDGVMTIGTAFGNIPEGLPMPALPDISMGQVLSLIGPAFAIALLGSIESLLSAVVSDGMAGTRHDSNQELIGQGIANMVVPLFGGFAATGAIARTATNVRNGGNSPLAAIVHSMVLVLIVVFLAPLASSIPLAVLAAILFVVAWNMSEAHHFVTMVRRAPRADVVILLVTFFLTIFVDLVIAVNIGVILATFHFLRRMAESVDVQQVTHEELARELRQKNLPALPADVLVYSVDGPFFFGAVEKFERALAYTHNDPKVIVIRLKWVPFIDITGLETLEEVIARLQSRGVRVLLSGANERVHYKMKKSGLVERVGAEYCFPDFALAVQFLQHHKESAL